MYTFIYIRVIIRKLQLAIFFTISGFTLLFIILLLSSHVSYLYQTTCKRNCYICFTAIKSYCAPSDEREVREFSWLPDDDGESTDEEDIEECEQYHTVSIPVSTKFF